MERLRRVHSLWSWLPAFRAVAETEHLPSASRGFGVSASALSRTLALLEENVGQPLFLRSGRRIELNHAGAQLLTSVRRAMRMIHDTLARLEHEHLVGPALLTARGLAAQSLLLAALPLLRARAPELRPQLLELPRERIASALLRGELDVALVESLIQHPELTTTPLCQAPRAIYCGRGHPLRRRPPGSLTAALEHEFAALGGAESSPRDDWPLARARRVAVRVESPRLLAALCERGQLLAVLPERYARARPRGALKRVGPADLLPPLEVFAVHRVTLGAPGRAEEVVEAARASVD